MRNRKEKKNVNENEMKSIIKRVNNEQGNILDKSLFNTVHRVRLQFSAVNSYVPYTERTLLC